MRVVVSRRKIGLNVVVPQSSWVRDMDRRRDFVDGASSQCVGRQPGRYRHGNPWRTACSVHSELISSSRGVQVITVQGHLNRIARHIAVSLTLMPSNRCRRRAASHDPPAAMREVRAPADAINTMGAGVADGIRAVMRAGAGWLCLTMFRLLRRS
jgi:hypothetical protein